MTNTAEGDPVLLRRQKIYRAVRLAKRVGYLLLLLAIVAFFAALLAGFPRWLVTTSITALIAACVVLPVPIVLGYGIRAAAREDRATRAQ